MISIANDFSVRPLGRYEDKDGQNTGEKFRRLFLVPAFKGEEATITIDLDGLKMLTTSFMEEAFGGLIRKEGFSAEEVLRRLKFTYSDEGDKEYENEIIEDIKNAESEIITAQ